MSAVADVTETMAGVMDVIPMLMLGMVMLWGIGFIAGPALASCLEDVALVRQKKREQEEAQRQRAAHARAEIALRGTFDEWLEAETLRLEIERAAEPANTRASEALQAATQARADNAARIAQLQQGKAVQPSGADTVQAQWDALRRLNTPAQPLQA